MDGLPLHQRLTTFVETRLLQLLEHYSKDGDLPPLLGGHVLRSDTRIDWMYTLSWLWKLGRRDLGGQNLLDLIARQLPHVDGAETVTFYSYRVAEVIEQFGGFSDVNPLLRGIGEDQIAQLRTACDSTGVYDRATGQMKFAQNYWVVLMRCEYARKRLGLPYDREFLQIAAGHVSRLLFESPRGFPDDMGGGRFDIYSTDMLLFAEPVAPELGEERWLERLRVQVPHFEALVCARGVSYTWGRSLGALSVCLTFEVLSSAMRLGFVGDKARTLAVLEDTLAALADWFGPTGLINAHEYRSPYGYRGPHRRMQMTLDCLGKLLYAAVALKEAGDLPTGGQTLDRDVVYPRQDVWLPFTDTGLGAWLYRGHDFGFRLAVVEGRNADYLPAPRMPGLFENPVDSRHVCWTPRLLIGGKLWLPAGLPTRSEHGDRSLSLDYEGWICEDARMAGTCSLTFAVDDGCVTLDASGTCDAPTGTVTIQIAEADRRLRVVATGAQQHATPVAGVAEMRSFWGELKTLHELHAPCEGSFSTQISVRPVPRVATMHGDHDYIRQLYGAMPRGEIDELPLRAAPLLPPGWHRNTDILHIGWPEHLFFGTDEVVLAANLALIESTLRAPMAVVWTQHNRLGHAKNSPAYVEIYDAWARRADLVLHHSKWGMDRMRALLPYKPTARHVVLPHGHYGELIRPALEKGRAYWEEQFGLPPCKLRLGIVGRPQKEKQVNRVMRAFAAAAPADWQLWVTAITADDPVVDDPRIIARPRSHIMIDRATIDGQLAVCDVLVSAHTGENYLTSGSVADAVGIGAPMIVPEWGFFREIMGEAAIYYGPEEGGLESAIRSLDDARLARARAAILPLRDAYAWPRLAGILLAELRALGFACR